MQITYTEHAWVPKYYSIDSVLNGDNSPSLSSNKVGDGGYFEREGYTYIGVATVTVEVNSPEQIVMDQVQALNSQLQAVRAEAQVKENAILLQISKLQSLTMG